MSLLTYRLTIEAIGALEPRKSALEDDFEEEEEKDEDDQPMDTDVGGHEKVWISPHIASYVPFGHLIIY